MHKLKCLILIFCFTSMQFAFADAVDTEMAAQKKACDANSAMEWSSKLNRCIGKKAAVDTRNAARACDAMTDLAAKKQCNIALAEKSTGLSSSTGSLNQGNTTGSMVMNSATTAYAVSSIISTWGTKGKNSSCTSKSIFATTSIAGLASDFYLKMKAKKAVEELEGKYAIDLKSTTTEAQVKALQYLKDEQQTVADIASLEKKRNLALMLGYGLAAGWAVYEMTPYGANPNCIPEKSAETSTNKTETPKNETITGDVAKAPAATTPVSPPATPPANPPANPVHINGKEIEPTKAPHTGSSIKKVSDKLISLTKSFFISDAYAAGDVPAASSTDNIIPKSFKEFLDSSFGIATISGIATVYSGILYKAADQQEQESNANIVKVDKMIKTFTDSGASVCMNGHDDLSNPKCYCYTDSGAKNSNRTNSQTCIDLWAKTDFKLNTNAANYSALVYNGDVAGCVTVDNQFDQYCKCKKLINSSGANACQKETTISLSSGALGTGFGTSAAKTLADYAANATNGNPRFDLLNPATLGAQAVKAARLAQDIATKIPSKDINYPLVNESNVGKYAKATIGEKAIAAASRSSALGVASSGPQNPALGTFLKEAQAKVGIEMVGSGKGLSATKEKKKAGMDFSFANEGSGNANGQVIANFPEEEKTYKFKNSDIATNNKASIFEIISNRYVQSGLKRLFEDEAK